jgi:CheY-like chemotaxis protein
MGQSWRGFPAMEGGIADKRAHGLRGHNPRRGKQERAMVQRVFVSVIGFTDTERHALNSVFRLSVEQEIKYFLWEPGAPEAPRLALVDGDSWEGRVEAESSRNEEVPLIWVGTSAPQRALRTFQRPIPWSAVVQSMDELVGPMSEPIDFDIDFNDVDTLPPDTQPPEMPPRRRALIVNVDRDERLYIRAKLALAELCEADEAENAAQALELARDNDYVVAVVDFSLPDGDGWTLLKELSEGQKPVKKLIVTKAKPSLVERVRARLAGTTGFFNKPPDPGKLHDLLLKV